MNRLRWLAVAALLMLGSIGIGVAGYYLGYQARPMPTSEPQPSPVWTDQEFTTHADIPFFRCTYHRADGARVVREYPIVSPNPIRACPPSP